MLLAFPEFLGNVSQIVSETPKSTIQAYLIWNLVNSYSSYVEAAEVEPITRFNNILSGRVSHHDNMANERFILIFAIGP